jgi:glycosyltransferase involved in cell wall biosynthesis
VRIYLLEPYFTGSHRQWAEGLQRRSRHEVHLVVHPGRFWKWRLQGGFATMAASLAAAVAADGPPDLVLGTSMLDLGRLLGSVRRIAGGAAAALYMHENQITYPPTGRTRSEAALGLANWSSLLAADGVAFNSVFHRDSLLAALPGFLGAFPDLAHDALIPGVSEKCVVVPVGMDLERIGPLRERRGPATFLWNHRWDPDKQIGEALAALAEAAAAGAAFRVVLAGESFVGQADEHREGIAALGERVVHVGHLDEAGYVEALHASDAVISAGRQEFFGVAVAEAMFAGALPVLPDRLVYPERVPAGLEERCLYRGRRGLVRLIRSVADDPEAARAEAARCRAAVEQFDWSTTVPRTDAWLESVAAAG